MCSSIPKISNIVSHRFVSEITTMANSTTKLDAGLGHQPLCRMAALRDLLLAVERAHQPLDDVLLSFSRSLLLSPLNDTNDVSQYTAENASSLALQFLTISPQCELLLRVWPDHHGTGSRWQRRESFATFLYLVTHLLQTQQQQDATQAEALALRVVREKTSQLEKLLTWSDKPLIEFRAVELLGAVAKVSDATARELVRLFNFQCPAFVKLSTRRWKKPELAEGGNAVTPPYQLRAAYVDLVLALTACSSKSVHRFAMREGGITSSLYKSMDGDSASMLRTIFDQLSHSVLDNKEVEQKSKLVVYNATCVHQLTSLLHVGDDESVRDTALQILNALFFDDSALYIVPQKHALRLFWAKMASHTHSQHDNEITSEQAYALKVIRHAIGTIRLNELLHSTQAQTLVMRFLATYPGFLSEYLAALSLSLEPKPAYRWFCVASLVQKLLLCPLDAVASGLPTGQSTDTSWCSAQSLASRLIAPGNCRKELSRCIQHSDHLVIYSSLGIIEATLKRYMSLASIAESLNLATQVQLELRFLLPSPEALVSLLLKLCSSQDRRGALIYVRALSVFRLYLECLPQTIREVKVDLNKIFKWPYFDTSTSPQPMQSLIIDEMLRFLLAVDTVRLRFLVTSANSDMHSKLQQMLLLYGMTSSRAMQKLCGKVLHRMLLATDIFGQEPDNVHGRASEEVAFWLESLRHSCSLSCAKFMEALVRAVLADIFMYVAGGRRVIKDASISSLSPVTVALVEFLNSRNERGRKTELSTYRDDPCVVAFAVRILLALMPTSQYPHHFISLIVSNDAVRLHEENEEGLRNIPNGKKRKRSVESASSSCQDDAYVWLRKYCETLGVEQQVDSHAHWTKIARATSRTWQCQRDLSAFTSALMSMSSVEFVSSWDQLVRNCADIDCSFTPLVHYLSAHADINLLTLLMRQTDSAAAQAFTEAVPVSLVLEHVLFNFAGQDAKNRNAAIATVTDMIQRRVNAQQLTATEAARMYEELLWFFATSYTVILHEGCQLCQLLLQLVTFALILDVPLTIWKRLLFKLQAVVTSTPNGALWRQLTAVQLVALRIYSCKEPGMEMALLCDFRSLFQRAGVPLVAVLASYVPMSVRIPVLDTLLHQYSAMTRFTPHVVLVARMIASLQRNSENDSFLKYKRANVVTNKLWQLLSCESGKKWHLSFFTQGFMLLRRFGGVEASTALKSSEHFLVPLVAQSAQTVSSSTEILRAMLRTIRSDNDAAAFPAVFEEHLFKRLQNETDVRVKCVLIAATYNVFARIQNPALRQFAKDLSRQCYEHLLLRSQESYAAEVAVLRHVSVDAGLSDALDPLYGAALTKLISSKRVYNRLTSAQLLGLCFMLRSHAHGRVDASLLPMLAKSGLFALKAAKNDQDEGSMSRRALEFKATIVLMENALSEGPNGFEDTKERSAVLKRILPHLAETRDVMQQHSSNFAFQSFVAVTSIVLRLVGDNASALDYDFAAHFNAVVHHPCFTHTLQIVDNDKVRIRVTRVVARLARITGMYTRSLLQTFLGAYSMSLSPFDRSLRVLFDAFEAQKVKDRTLLSFGFRFGASSTLSLLTKDSYNDLVDDSAWLLNGGLEQSRIRATIEHFPLDRKISTADDVLLLELDAELPIAEVEAKMVHEHAQAYDPAFLLPMLAHFTSSSDLSESGIVQQGLLGVAIHATSSTVTTVREYAYGILVHLHECLQATTETSSDFKAGRQVHLLLDVFRRGIQEPLEQVPSLITVFLNDALAVLLKPTHVLYPHVNHFLLARSALDLADVPMFYSLFNSRAPLTFRQERSWLLHTLRRGVRNDTDMMLLERRHVLPMLLSFYSSELADTHTQPLITSILLAALRTPSGGVYLAVKAGLLPWLTVQFLNLGPAVEKVVQLLPLMTLVEQILQNRVWNELDASHQHTMALQAIGAFSAMHAAITTRRTGLRTDDLAKAAAIAMLVVQRAGFVSHLELLSKALEMVHGAKALESAAILTNNLSQWILQQRRPDVQKARFVDWAVLLQQVASTLVWWHSTGTLTQQKLARRGIDQLKAVLDQVPTLKQHVLSADLKMEYAPAIL